MESLEISEVEHTQTDDSNPRARIVNTTLSVLRKYGRGCDVRSLWEEISSQTENRLGEKNRSYILWTQQTVNVAEMRTSTSQWRNQLIVKSVTN